MSLGSSWIHVIEIAFGGAVIYMVAHRQGARRAAARERERVAEMIQKTLGILWSPTLHQILVWVDGNQTEEQLLAHTKRDAEQRKERKIVERL